MNRLLSYVKWFYCEIFTDEKNSDIYNNLSLNNNYETTIDYPDRVLQLKKVVNRIPVQYRSVLDLACGTGAMIDAYPRNIQKITGIDSSIKMLSLAKKRFAKRKNIHLKLSDLNQLEISKNSYDVISITFSSRFIKPEKSSSFFLNVFNGLSKEGRLIVVLHDSLLEPLFILIQYLIKIPKGYSIGMNFTNYFTRKASHYFEVESVVKLNRKFLLFRNVGIVFRPKSIHSV